jgi:hypothetical protein
MDTSQRIVLKGKSNGVIYSVEKGLSTENFFSADLYYGDDPTFGILVGSYSLDIRGKEESRRELEKSFLKEEFSKIPEAPYWFGHISLVEEHRNQGLSRSLVDLAMEELEKLKALHIETFTFFGRERILPHFIRRDYNFVRPKSGKHSPLVWKDYS